MVQKILILFNIIIALAATGLVVYSHLFLKPPPTNQEMETKILEENAQNLSQIAPVTLKKIVVNLFSRSSRLRYLDLQLSVLTFREDQKKIIEENEFLFKDVVIQLASKVSPEDVSSMTGKILLQNRIKKRMNQILRDEPVVKQIYFSRFVVQ